MLINIDSVLKRITSVEAAEIALVLLPELSTDIFNKFPQLRPID